MNSHRKMTPKGQMSSSGMGPAIHHLPIHIRALFEPNLPLTHLSQLTKRKMPGYTGVADFVAHLEKEQPPKREYSETPRERKERLRQEQIAKHNARLEEEMAKWEPNAPDDRKTGDAYRTLFVGRVSYETTEKQLRHEFEQYGAVRSIRLVEDSEGKSRGYAFVEYEHESDLKTAFRHADGKKIDGRRVVVDVERGRTVHEWKPRKFGGGIGETRKGGADVNVKYSGREPIGDIRVGQYKSGGAGGHHDHSGASRYAPRPHGDVRSRIRSRSNERTRENVRKDRKRSRSITRERKDGYRERSRDRHNFRDHRSVRPRDR